MTVAERFDVFLIDLDGVVYLGGEPLPGAVEAVNRLDRMGKRVRFLTNDPRPRRSTIARRLGDLGIQVEAAEIVTSGWATARYLSREGIASVSTVGSDGLLAELRARGLRLTEEEPEAVVVGADEHTSYRDIQRATRHIDRGATFVGTNPDGAFPTPEGPAPGAGAIVRAVEAATGVEPVIVGKPEPPMFEMALEDLPDRARAVVIGDRAETDVLGAHRAGLTGILVADEEGSYPTPADFRRPDGRISGLDDLFEVSVSEWRPPGHPWPDQIRPGVAAIVVDDAREVLLVKRADRQRWALPTGTVEPGESLTRALRREVKEETGLHIQIDRLKFDIADPSSDDARYCLDAYFDELDDRFEDGFDPRHSISADADELTEPRGVLLLARLDGDPVGCGALKLHDDASAEIKRMWVDRSARGLGLGRRLLRELEEQARIRGVTKVRLETNDTLTEAIRLYRSAGYEEVEPFNDEPYAHRWFEKRIEVPADASPEE